MTAYLSCECDEDWYPEPGDQGISKIEYSTLQTSKRQRCWSCERLIEIGADVLVFSRYKVPYTDVEIKIYGDDGEIDLANKYHCERCGDIYLSLEELGFCVYPEDNQFELLDDYHKHYSPQAQKRLKDER